MNKFKYLRILLAFFSLTACLLVFLDVTGTIFPFFGWITRIQFIPAVLSLNVIVLILLIALTLLFGRLYCAIICPLGIMQDIFAKFRPQKYPYNAWKNTKKLKIVHDAFLIAWIVSAITGFSFLLGLLDPYAIFGRIATALFSPVYDATTSAWGEQGASDFSPMPGMSAFVLSAVFFVGLVLAAIFTGRGYCNAVCPVGAFLGFLSKFAVFKMYIDPKRCVHCQKCSRQCKAHCIQIDKNHASVDASLCVTCMNCLSACSHGAIRFGRPPQKTSPCHDSEKTNAPSVHAENKTLSSETDVSAAESQTQKTDQNASHKTNINLSRRRFFCATASVAAPLIFPQKAFSQDDLSPVSRKSSYPRAAQIIPPGADALSHFQRHCVGCTLCVRACQNRVLRLAKTGVAVRLQPQLSFEYGYCRPTCNACSTVCPTHAIRPITLSQKSRIQIGKAVWRSDLCVNMNEKNAICKACARLCPTQAIAMTNSVRPNGKKTQIPTIDETRCIGCGACEYVCAARPLAAIHVEGNGKHQTL